MSMRRVGLKILVIIIVVLRREREANWVGTPLELGR